MWGKDNLKGICNTLCPNYMFVGTKCKVEKGPKSDKINPKFTKI